MRRAHAVVASGWRCYGYVWFVGRADDVITSAAYRIGSFEVESALVEHPAVAEAAVVGKPVPLRGQIVKAYARARLHLTMHVSGSKSGVSVRTVRRIPDGRGASEVCAAVRGAVATVSDATARPLGENNMSALPLRPFGVPDLVWPSEICKACYQPQWSDALRDWEFVEEAAGPCVACQGRRVRGLGRNGRGSR